MRVLFFTHVYPSAVNPHHGPFNRELVANLTAEHDVRVVCPIGWTEGAAALAAGGFRGQPLASVVYPTYYYVPRLFYSTRDTVMWLSVRRRLRRLVRAWAPDLILAYWVHPDGAVAQRIAGELRVPFVQLVGGSDVLLVAPGQRRRKVARTLANADAVVTVGEALRRRVIDLGTAPIRVTSVYRPVSATFVPGSRRDARRAIGVPLDARIVVWVGRLVDVKNPDLLIDAVHRMAGSIPALRVYLIGDGAARASLRSRVRRSQLGSVVQFVDPAAHDAVAVWYRAADVTALTSRSEGVPNVLLESIACGTPFVATRVGGVAEIADPSEDFVVAPGDSAAFAQALTVALRRNSADVRPPRIIATAGTLRDQFARVFEAALRGHGRGAAESSLEARA